MRGNSDSNPELGSRTGCGRIMIPSRPARCAGPVHTLDTAGDGSVCKTQAVRERKILNCEGKREGGKRNEKDTHNLNFA